MTRAIWKFPIAFGVTVHTMPRGSEVVHFALQGGRFTLWAKVNPSEPQKETRAFTIVGTGHAFSESYSYLGSVIDADGFVWHACEGVE